MLILFGILLLTWWSIAGEMMVSIEMFAFYWVIQKFCHEASEIIVPRCRFIVWMIIKKGIVCFQWKLWWIPILSRQNMLHLHLLCTLGLPFTHTPLGSWISIFRVSESTAFHHINGLSLQLAFLFVTEKTWLVFSAYDCLSCLE